MLNRSRSRCTSRRASIRADLDATTGPLVRPRSPGLGRTSHSDSWRYTAWEPFTAGIRWKVNQIRSAYSEHIYFYIQNVDIP